LLNALVRASKSRSALTHVVESRQMVVADIRLVTAIAELGYAVEIKPLAA
jgi:hypothetical protein